jgi:hypothetical protein
MQAQIFANLKNKFRPRGRQFGLFSSKTSITVHLNMSERENSQLPLAKGTHPQQNFLRALGAD